MNKQGRRASDTCTNPTVMAARNPRISDLTQRYTKVIVPPPTNSPTHVERRKQRVAVHWNKISMTPSSHDPIVRTSAHQEIETDVHESVRESGGLHGSESKTSCEPE